MAYAKIILWINGLFLAGMGFAFIVAPHFMYALSVHAVPPSPNAVIDIRAAYGGFNLGVGLFVLIVGRAHMKLCFKLLILILLCLAGARILGLMIDKNSDEMMLVALAVEITFLVLNAIAYKKLNLKTD